MVTNSRKLDRAFGALAGATRRKILGRLAQGDATVGETSAALPRVAAASYLQAPAGAGAGRPSHAETARAHQPVQAGRGSHAQRRRMGRALPRLLGGRSGSVGTLHRRDESMSAVTYQLRVSRTIGADPETLFQAWTDPQKLMHW